MEKTPKSMRLHIGIFGKRNVGKSSLMNLITHQDTSIVSKTAGTTTDAVEKTMEMLPIGPIVLIDTAGIDDEGELGKQRIEKSLKVIDRVDVAIIVCDYEGWSNYERDLVKIFRERKTPILAVINKKDISVIEDNKREDISKNSDYQIEISADKDNEVAARVREGLIRIVPEDFIKTPSILGNLVESKDTVILVTPIDKEAPKGRLIMPQVNVLRELLDRECISVVVTEKNLKQAIEGLKELPKAVITDSQAFKEVSEIVPKEVLLTSFSILFARLKGDIEEFYKGVKTIDELEEGDKVLICESCTHHAIEDDIGRVKIPKLIQKRTGKQIQFEHITSHELIDGIEKYRLIIHCGGCMTNRREILTRIEKAKMKRVPITNYGMVISYCIGILDRAMEGLK
jgi:[FeFe] hydrogenase H-cluster maturation GTPase HydF